ncbi:hypothetical protein GCM10025867_48000 (plasmid) [Frondihabitans sucicola]|uniref:Uncharacterized protein n=1 Tax=Frondihabitans sucicola TaxID=1268041 RepID=A0ABM8GVR3_9MICO|nr:hypothetical protein [Frondihabitans sucicola]BDZ52559.1 hypothetical protein GCM10025867_48000 [Frondihabitans sucicola]
MSTDTTAPVQGSYGLEITFVLDSEQGWLQKVYRQDGPVRRLIVSTKVAPDIVLAIMQGIDYYVPEAAENYERSNMVTFVATATHRALQGMDQKVRRAASAVRDLETQRENFRSALINVIPSAPNAAAPGPTHSRQ